MRGATRDSGPVWRKALLPLPAIPAMETAVRPHAELCAQRVPATVLRLVQAPTTPVSTRTSSCA